VIYSRITGTGSYLPENVVTNKDLEKTVDTTDQWIFERTGIQQRHIAAADEYTCDLAEKAARNALDMAGLKPQDIDLVVVATTTADQVFPSTACLLQARLGIHGPAAFDVQAVCTGFVYALSVADKFIKTGAATKALVIGAETFSRIIDWSDRNTCVLFGDGAGAVVIEAGDQPGIISTHLHADGAFEQLLRVPAGISRGYTQLQASEAYVEMRGNEVFKMAVTTLGRIVDETLAANGMKKSDVDWLIPHQANIRIINARRRNFAPPWSGW
jgi:3-oxoacyl-[acyl-carrier-protein] synthase-3